MLARKKQEARQSASEEARKQALWEERKRAREEEEKAAASGVKPKSTQEKLLDPVSVAVSESKWDRLMNGGGKKKKTKRAPAAAEAAGQGGGGGSERKKPGEEGVVDWGHGVVLKPAVRAQRLLTKPGRQIRLN